MEFAKFKHAVAQQFSKMEKHELFRTDVEKDELWETYLGSFPEGSNPIYRERTEHDCNCCKSFIRVMGNVVAIQNGKLVSIWDGIVDDPNYTQVANAMANLVKSRPIINIFLHTERTAGVDCTFEDAMDGTARRWNHFFVRLPNGKNGEKNFVATGDALGERLGDARAVHDVLKRGLEGITVEAIEIVNELIAQDSLYRGSEHKQTVTMFYSLKKAYDEFTGDKDYFVWERSRTVNYAVSKIRNTSIGTLLVDLSEGEDIDKAVRAFEAKVAPTNYKRPKAVVTKGMIEEARKKVEELGLASALPRRYATLTDINVNNILFADREARKSITGDVFDDLMGMTTDKKPKNLDKVEEIPIEQFVSKILPTVSSLEVFVENKHMPNFVSLVAPVDPTAGKLFKWDNNFSWAYNGEVADSIKERVKQAGGNITGDLCFRLAWFNYDDLDLHMIEPNGYHIHFGNRRDTSPCGGRLDVDMNAGYGQSRTPVENIFYSNRLKMRPGRYKLFVNQFNRREAKDGGFEVEAEILGKVTRYAYSQVVPDKANITVLEFEYSKEKGITVFDVLKSSSVSRELWGIPTEKFHKVSTMMLSPNYWDGRGVGNKHYFFTIDGCVNPESTRGFFNEFLHPELDKNRKVFEVLGSRMQTPPSVDQLSGIGFSTTQRNDLLCRVTGSFTRTIKLVF